ncbi:MAG: hypothetical protein IT380_07320 [Myxococcales bacterium]|nr:hypothetical protein [Myxococcales bacterium]
MTAYLSPEPMLQDPSWVQEEASAGFTTPTYAYAVNAPLRYVDLDGLRISATVVNDSYGWIPGCTPKPGGGKTCARVARDGALGQCRPSSSGCGYGFDVSVNSYIASHFSPQTDPKGQSVGDPPGFTLENHEFGHRLDLQFDFAEPALNQSIQTEGFASQAECERARASFDANLDAYKFNSMLDSVMRRDRY